MRNSLFIHKFKFILVVKHLAQAHHKNSYQLSWGTISSDKWVLVIDSKRQKRAASSSACTAVLWPSALTLMLDHKLPGDREQASTSPDNSQSLPPFSFQRHHSTKASSSSVIGMLMHSHHYDRATTLCHTHTYTHSSIPRPYQWVW